jgi:phenylalanyl-tRNA synthetase beta chain
LLILKCVDLYAIHLKDVRNRTMKLSYRWLGEYVDIEDIGPDELSHRLTMCTSEIESVEEVGGNLDGVVVGKILEVKPHPDSDHLFLTKVDVGKEVLPIVSGAPNTAPDTHVPVALVGAQLPGGMKVKRAKLRGAESRGVVCSERELGVSDDHSGLWLLDGEGIEIGNLKPGTPVEALFSTLDYIFEIDNKNITNRPDLWGMYGFVREIAAIFGRKSKTLIAGDEMERIGRGAKGPEVKVEILDEDLCPRYTAVALSGIRIEKSPFSVRRRLSTLGVRPISNIVDVTNYVMLLTGQPLHAFDARQIAERKIVVRRAREGERVTTLDAVERPCSGETLLITDPEKAVAVAGIMGGLNSEIDGTTDEIIIESANFNATSIRRTALRLGLRTEASNRFEKSLDPELAMYGLAGSAAMVLDLVAGSRLSSPLADVYPGKPQRKTITINTGWVSRLLGMHVEKRRILDILNSLQFEVKSTAGNEVKVVVPSFRAIKDVTIPQDLVEEVGRVYGYDNIKPELPRIESSPPPRVDLLTFTRGLKILMAEALAFTEVYTYSFVEDSACSLFYNGTGSFVKLKNPVSNEMSRLRRSLVPNLLGVVEKNSAGRDRFSVFEIGSVYSPDNGLPDERQRAAGMIFGKVDEKDSGSLFFEVKGALELLFHRLDLVGVAFSLPGDRAVRREEFDVDTIGTSDVFHPGRIALLCSGEICFGVLSELNPRMLKMIGMDFHQHRAGFFEMETGLLADLVKGRRAHKRYRPIPRYPEVVLALAVVVDEHVPVRGVQDLISSFASELIERVRLFDVYRGKPLEEGKKSLAFNVYYRRQDRTLTEEEANEVHERIAQKIRDHGWDLR